MEIVLERFSYSPMGTFSTLWLPENILYTVERPWLDNTPRWSCIPEGEYVCKPRRYNRGGYDAIHVTNVPNRSYILMHKGNTMHDLEGCIAVGTNLGSINGVWGVENSSRAFSQLMEWANEVFKKEGQFKLIIRSVDNGN